MSSSRSAGHGPLGALRQAAGWHRRLLAAGLAALALALAIGAARPPAPARYPVVTAARDLPAGTVLTAGDLQVRRLPAAARPPGALRQGGAARGRILAAPLRAGEVLTDVRLVGRALLASLPAGSVAAPVRVGDAGSTALLRSGDLVDVLAANPDTGTTRTRAQVVAAAAPVLALVAPGPDDVGQGGLLLLAVDADTAAALAQAAVSDRISVVLDPR